MKTDFNENFEIWKNHIANAKAHPSGVAAYCEENNIKSSVYYGWRQVIKNAATNSDFESLAVPKQTTPSFYPVEISEALTENLKSFPGLPDARWVAEVMLHLLRGLS